MCVCPWLGLCESSTSLLGGRSRRLDRNLQHEVLNHDLGPPLLAADFTTLRVVCPHQPAGAHTGFGPPIQIRAQFRSSYGSSNHTVVRSYLPHRARVVCHSSSARSACDRCTKKVSLSHKVPVGILSWQRCYSRCSELWCTGSSKQTAHFVEMLGTSLCRLTNSTCRALESLGLQ